MEQKYDVIIVGLGAMGSAAAYQLSKSNKKVLGLDQFSPPHSFGSSHGDTRITREPIGEGRTYTPLVQLSNRIWKELKNSTGEDLLNQCGGLVIAHGNATDRSFSSDPFLNETIEAAKQFAVPHEVLNHSSLSNTFPQFKYQGDEVACFDHSAGYLRPEKCIEVQLSLAKKNGVTLLYDSPVLSISPDSNNEGAHVVTRDGTFRCDTLVLTVGAWINQFLPSELSKNFKIYRQVLHWFETKIDITKFYPENFGVYIWHGKNPKDRFYGFPAVDGEHGGIKLATEQYETTCSLETFEESISQEEVQEFYSHFSQFINISSQCLRSVACKYTVTPDDDFVIDRLPQHPQIIVASPCSGHGFKHSAGIGRILKEMTDADNPTINISHLNLSRFSDR